MDNDKDKPKESRDEQDKEPRDEINSQYNSILDKYNKEGLKQANKSFCFSALLALIGFLFFLAPFSLVFFSQKNVETNFTEIKEKLAEVSSKLAEVSSEPAEVSSELAEVSSELAEVSSELAEVSSRLVEERKYLAYLRRELIFASSVGGIVIEIISAIIFGRAASQKAENLHRYQRFFLANSICDKLENKDYKQTARNELIKVIAGVPSADDQSTKQEESKKQKEGKE